MAPSTVIPHIVELRTRILKKNDELARARAAGVRRLRTAGGELGLGTDPARSNCWPARSALCAEHYAVAAVVGDLATDNDAAPS